MEHTYWCIPGQNFIALRASCSTLEDIEIVFTFFCLIICTIIMYTDNIETPYKFSSLGYAIWLIFLLRLIDSLMSLWSKNLSPYELSVCNHS